MVKKFENTAFSLKVGQISDIVRTQFGYHIIKCIGKKAKQKRNYEEVKNTVKEFLMQQQMEKKYELWLGNLRDKAIITKIGIKQKKEFLS